MEDKELQNWEKRLTEIHKTQPIKSKFSFSRLIRTLDIYGFDPNLSAIEAGISPAVVNNGSHRLGYSIVHCKTQKFIPVRPGYSLWYPVDGIKFYKQMGLTNEELIELLNRYAKIIDELEHDYIALVDERFTLSASFAENMRASGCSCISGPISTVNLSYKDSTNYKKFLKKLKGIENVRCLKIPMRSQFLMYKNKKLISRESEAIGRIFEAEYGKNWGIISSCITESIELQIFLQIFCDFDAKDENMFHECL